METSFNKFLQYDFFDQVTGLPHLLRLQYENDFPKGTKNDITKEQLKKVQDEGGFKYFNKHNEEKHM